VRPATIDEHLSPAFLISGRSHLTIFLYGRHRPHEALMAKKQGAAAPAHNITPERAARLYRLVQLLGRGAQTRTALVRALRLNVRGFYRDLEVLRAAGIAVELVKQRYTLEESPAKAVERLPIPDPGLTLGEARQLARGRTRAHEKLRRQIRQIER
jgi:hypothetical protein